MDAGSFSFSPEKIRQISQKPLDRVVFIPSLRNTCSNSWASWNSGDRFIPDRSAMDFDVARYLLSQPNKKEEENPETVSPAKVAYRKLLAETLLNNRTRIMSFNRKPAISADSMLSSMAETCNSSSGTTKSTNNKKKKRFISQKAERILDAPDLADDFYLNLLDWGSRNVLSIALGNTVYLWNASNSSVSALMSVEDEIGGITSVSWAADGHHLAVGLENSDVQLWDSTSAKLLRTLKGIHGSRVGALAWNNCVLTTGGMDGKIVNNDVRIRSPQVKSFMGHREQVCGLKWCASGKQLASGGNDNLVHIWDLSAAPSNQNQWLHRFDDHNAAVKALAWCPFSNNLLASGGGGSDRCIKFWNTSTGACLSSVDTGSQVSGLQWSKNERELLSSHGFTGNHLTLWKYPSMLKLTELHGHTSRVLHLAQSPNGCTVATAAGDETLRFWNVFGNPEADKPARTTTYSEAFANLSRLR